jgi:hypothetical protein
MHEPIDIIFSYFFYMMLLYIILYPQTSGAIGPRKQVPVRQKRTEGKSYFCTMNVRFEQYM